MNEMEDNHFNKSCTPVRHVRRDLADIAQAHARLAGVADISDTKDGREAIATELLVEARSLAEATDALAERLAEYLGDC